MSDIFPDSMRIIEIVKPGGPEELQLTQRPVPQAAANELLIKIRAAGVNRPDVIQRQGYYPAPEGASDIPGLEIAGDVVAIGQDVKNFKVGDKVVALLPGGGYAEYATVHASNALPIPDGFGYVEAAAIPETFFTVWHNVFQLGQLKKGDIFLVHGGSSGIGTTAIQLAKAFGATVITTAGSKAKCDACLKLGADLAIPYHEQDFVAAVKDFTNGKGANVILDMVGGDYTNRNYQAAAIEGRIVQIAFLNGAKANINLSYLMTKRLTHTGSTLRARSVEFKAALAQELKSQVWPLLENRSIVPLIDMIYPLSDAWRAHQRMEESNHIGKIILDVA